jgi:hypothetical protein
MSRTANLLFALTLCCTSVAAQTQPAPLTAQQKAHLVKVGAILNNQTVQAILTHWRNVDQIPVNSVRAFVSDPNYAQPKSVQERAPVAVLVTVRGPYTPAEGDRILSDLKHELVKYPDTRQTSIEVVGTSGNAPPNIRPEDMETDLLNVLVATPDGDMLNPSRYPVIRKDGYSYSITKGPPIR